MGDAELPNDSDRALAMWALAVQAQREDVTGALSTLARIIDDSHRADAARQVAAAQAQAGQVAEALAWASREISPLVKAQAPGRRGGVSWPTMRSCATRCGRPPACRKIQR
jgi:hypothetical protein